ncbi:hypothetical protein [Pectobacterium peruviense]|nr:hypothetical protein [Pectobacterium peruviense]
MMSLNNRFKQPIVTVLAKRAANRCSNPSCRAITSGPSSDPNDSVNLGEAAHIYGAHQGSARYESSMTSMERSAISNAIWLCGNCHKLVDDDPTKYPAGLLFEWQREHENYIAKQVGQVAFEIKKRYEERHLSEFGKLSYLAERLILEKEDYWEYQLTAEVLRFEMNYSLQRWNALKQGLYIKPIIRITDNEFFEWMLDRFQEITLITEAFTKLINFGFKKAWGELGEAGKDTEIVSICKLYAEVCKSALEWEEIIYFSRVSGLYSEIHKLFLGIAGNIIEQAEKLPAFLSDMVTQKPISGTFSLDITIELPDGWEERFEQALKNIEIMTDQ